MNSGFPLIEIVIYALIAAFFAFRLRGVLGKRTGTEKQRPNPFEAPPSQPKSGQEGPADQGPDNVVRMPDRRGEEAMERPEDDVAPDSLAGGLTQIKIADPSFDERGFLEGAQAAFGMILEAFANGDRQTLRNLQADEVFTVFEDALTERENQGESLETKILEIKTADIVSAKMDGPDAVVTVKFVTDQINVSRDKDGQIIDGSPENVEAITDIWTFRRDTGKSDPNWALSETATE